MRNSLFIVISMALVFPALSSAQDLSGLEAAVGSFGTSTASSTQSALDTVKPDAFCVKAATVTEAIRAEAAMRAAEHRADMDRLALARDEEKRKVSAERVEQRAMEDSSRDALLSLLREQATSTVQISVIDEFGSTSAKLLANLRTQSDKARDSYAKVTRNDSLVERAARNHALDAYVDQLDIAAQKAEERCRKGVSPVDALTAYNATLKGAKQDLAKNLRTKKTSLEARAKEAHLAELARLDREYRAGMQQAILKLMGFFPDFFESLVATSTPEVAASSTATTSVATSTAQ